MEVASSHGPVVKGAGRQNDADATDDVRGGGWWCARYTVALMLFLGLAAEYTLRVNMSIAVVAMVRQNVSSSHDNSTHTCPPLNDSSTQDQTFGDGEFDWDETTQGLVLGCFYYGYACTNLLGGRLAEVFGGKWVFGCGVVASALLSLLGPVCARTSLGLFVASRVAVGFMQGFTYPVAASMMATWFPPKERAKFGAIVYGGMQFGTIVALSLSGMMCASGFLGGWPSVFYVFGVVAVAWGLPWFLLIHERPEDHPRISRAELEYLTAAKDSVKKAEVVKIPWKSIVTSRPVWAALVSAFGGSFCFYTLLSEIPTYLAHIQNLDISKNGLLSSLPYICLWVVGVVWGAVMDRLLAHDVLSVTAVRKISSSVSQYIPACFLVVLCFVGCDATLAMVVLCVAVGVNGASYSGNALMEQDIAPNLAGTLVGITNTASSITGFVAPAVAAAITQGNQDSVDAWRRVFVVSAGFYAVTCTFYLFFMSAKVQPWNDPAKERPASDRTSSNTSTPR